MVLTCILKSTQFKLLVRGIIASEVISMYGGLAPPNCEKRLVSEQERYASRKCKGEAISKQGAAAHTPRGEENKKLHVLTSIPV